MQERHTLESRCQPAASTRDVCGWVGEDERKMSFWYNVDTGKVETDANRSRGEQVLGPYATEADAQAALDKARANTEKWDSDDRSWNEKGINDSDAD